MPFYEAIVLVRPLAEPQLKICMKRLCGSIFERKGMIRSLNYLGTNKTPYKISAEKKTYKEAAYFLIECDLAVTQVDNVKNDYQLDIDVLRRTFYRVFNTNPKACTLDEESQPPAYRPRVKKMIEAGKFHGNPFTEHFEYKSGLDYYPFQR